MSGAAPDRRAAATALREWRLPVRVEAGAGTGKTTILVARIVAWALGPGWERHAAGRADAPASGAPTAQRAEAAQADAERVAASVLSGIVAITFTEAAAAEMALRVGAALRAVAAGETVPLLEHAELPAPEARAERARALLACLDQLPVQTIHAFCRRLLAAHAVEAGLHPRFQVDADEQALFAAARAAVEGALREAYAEEDGDALRLAADGIGPPELEEALCVLVQGGVSSEALRRDPLAPEVVARFAAELESALDDFARHEDGLLLGNRRRRRVVSVAEKLLATRERVRAFRAGEPDAGAPGDVVALSAELAALWEDPKDVAKLRDFARGKFGSAAGDLGEAGEPLTRACAEVQPRLDVLRRLDPERLRRPRRLLAPLVAQVESELRRRGWLTYGGLLREARDLLVREPAARAAFQEGIDQLLIDEFQDTDGIQCEIVRRLALEGPEQARPGLFVVGDPKQSIYGWRSADLRAYHAFARELDRAGGRAGELIVNRRSVPPILGEVERCVAPVMQPRPGVQPAFQALACSREDEAGFAAEGSAPVEHWVSWPWDEASDAPDAKPLALEASRLEARAVAADLRRLHAAGVPWSGFALLFRGVGQLDVYLSELRDAGIPYVVERDRTFYQRREIIDAIALVRAVLDPHDHVALVAALRSAAVGVPDAALLPLWRAQLPALLARLPGGGAEAREAARRAIREAAEALPPGAPAPARERGWEVSLLAFVDAVAGLREAAEREPPERFVERLRTTLALEPLEAGRSLGPWRLANLDRLFRDLVRALEEGAGDVAGVLATLRGAVSERREEEEGRPRDAAADAVHVGTIHKAKGLAFDHVYLCQTHKGKGGGGARPHAVAHRSDEVALRLFGQEDLAFPCLAAEGRAVEEAEQVRTLYVALTRARERLVVAGVRAGRRNGSHAVLLAASDPPAEELAEWMRAARADGRAHHDAHGVRWVFPALRSDARAAAAAPAARSGADDVGFAERLARDEARLAVRRRRAAARAARPFHRIASEGHGALAESRARRADGADGAEGAEAAEAPGHGAGAGGGPEDGAAAAGERVGRLDRALDREAALAAGQAVHAALEGIGLAGPEGGDAQDPERFAEALRSALESALPEDAEEPARRRARALLERFLAGPLAARLRALAPHVVARELPVLLPPAAAPASAAPEGSAASRSGEPPEPCGEASEPSEEPVGFWSGAVDLLYRDPEDGSLVVVDYKTDAVEGEALAARAHAYAGQGAVYVRAVQEALQLPEPPRFELWFLHAGEVVTPQGPSSDRAHGG